MRTKQIKNMHITGKKPKRSTSPQGQQKVPDKQIVYTPAKPFNRNRFLLRLITVVAVVLALVFGMSIFFKVQFVEVSGGQKYSAWEIKEASGIAEGDALLSLGKARIGARIRTALPYVSKVRVGIKLPDTVKLEITELDAVYAIADSSGGWWLLNAAGKVVDKTNGAEAKGYTQILGVALADPVIGQQAAASVPETTAPTQTGEEGETQQPVPPVALVQPAQQLEAAITVLTALESNGIVGPIKTVDVTEPNHLQLWYEDRYDVYLGNTGRMDYKIRSLKAAVAQMGEYQTGHLDVSFTTWPDQVGYNPFFAENP